MKIQISFLLVLVTAITVSTMRASARRADQKLLNTRDAHDYGTGRFLHADRPPSGPPGPLGNRRHGTGGPPGPNGNQRQGPPGPIGNQRPGPPGPTGNRKNAGTSARGPPRPLGNQRPHQRPPTHSSGAIGFGGVSDEKGPPRFFYGENTKH